MVLFLLDETSHEFFIATHSNHILDLAESRDDVVIHSIHQMAPKEFEIREKSKHRELLFSLGVHASSVYLSNCTIWIEGITDRIYLQTYMKKYVQCIGNQVLKQKYQSFMENLHYAFVEYQGAGITHWTFEEVTDKEYADGSNSKLKALKTCAHPFVIADGDIRSPQKATTREALKRELGDQFFELDGKEIENLLPLKIVQIVAKELHQSKRIDKSKFPVEVIESLTESYYTSPNGLGFHLDSLWRNDQENDNQNRIFAEQSGTLKDKMNFCKRATAYMEENNDWELTTAATGLCKRIFDHITKHNTT